MNKPYIALVGRPNTGKSTLFNRLAGQRISIVEDTPGVTRDRIVTESSWCGNAFYIIDTGGIEPENDDIILTQMRRQAEIAMDMADVIVFIADARQGMTAADREIATMIRKSGRPCVLAVNKIDDWNNSYQAYDFYDLGLGDPLPLSAEHGLGLGDVLDEVVAKFPEEKKGEENAEGYKIAVVGKPNAGKSTLINHLLGEERVIVSEVAGTTRDAIDTIFSYEGEDYVLIDTAGIRRKNKTYSAIDHYALVRATRAIERSDICLLMIDGTQGVTEQDVKIAGMISEAYRAVLILINKWDLVEKETNTMAQMEKDIRKKLHFIDYAPILFLSALGGSRTEKLMPAVQQVIRQYEKRVTTGLLNEVVGDAVLMNSTPSKAGKHLKIYYASQVSAKPPAIVLFVNDDSLTSRPYTRYLEGRLRAACGFDGTPLKIIYRNKSEKV